MGISSDPNSGINIVFLLIVAFFIFSIYKIIQTIQYKMLTKAVSDELGYSNLNIFPAYDEFVSVKSSQTLNKYDKVKFFKENKGKLNEVEIILKTKKEIEKDLKDFLGSNKYMSKPQYWRVKSRLKCMIDKASYYVICVNYTSPAGRKSESRYIYVSKSDIRRFKADPSLIMTKTEYNKLIKERQKKALDKKQHNYYNRINSIIDLANANKDSLVVTNSRERLDELIRQLYDRTINSIKKIKSVESDEWKLVSNYITNIKDDVEKIINDNQRIFDYYNSHEFETIKETCSSLMSSQREFNEYIDKKVKSISKLFGTRLVRDETEHNDTYNYIRPYKKTITPFTAEVSKAVFGSAENAPLEYIIKYFYPNKAQYSEQIEKLSQLIEELETLKDARKIIDNYKAEYLQYLKDVPNYVIENDEDGFYTRLGFANINENAIMIEYRFSYTSDGGLVQKSFSVPMTEETIADLIKALENKLTASAFAKEQRTLMTKKLREHILKRDNYTCCNCGNSITKEPNLLLEVDHIVPIAKGGRTEESNLQTLCWRCNRAKGDKILTSTTR